MQFKTLNQSVNLIHKHQTIILTSMIFKDEDIHFVGSFEPSLLVHEAVTLTARPQQFHKF